MVNTVCAREGIVMPRIGQYVSTELSRCFENAFADEPQAHGNTWWTAGRLATMLLLLALEDSNIGLGKTIHRVCSLWPEAAGEDAARTYQGFINALHRLDDYLLDGVASTVRQEILKREDAHSDSRVILAVDGSKVALPHTASNAQKYGATQFKQRGDGLPQACVNMLWHLDLGVPWDWRIEPGNASERASLLEMLPDTPLRCLIVGRTSARPLDRVIRTR